MAPTNVGAIALVRGVLSLSADTVGCNTVRYTTSLPSQIRPERNIVKNLIENLHLLDELGVPQDIIQAPQSTVVTNRGVHHVPRMTVHYVAPELAAQPSSLVLSELSLENACHCLFEEEPSGPSYWDLMNLLLECHLSALEVPNPRSYDDISFHHTTLTQSLDMLVYEIGRRQSMNWPLLETATFRVRDELEGALAALNVQVRSPEFRSLLPCGKDAGTWQVVGLSGPASHLLARTPLVSALFLTYGQERGDNLFLVVPSQHMEPLNGWISSLRKDHRETFTDIYQLRPADTPDVVEVAAALWEPLSKGFSGHLAGAFEAARELVGAPT